MEENKEAIVTRLSLLLKETRAGWGLDRLKLSEDKKTVQIVFLSGTEKSVNVECDSGIAIIQDVIRALM
ncbi:MAG: hypothetical protein OSJ72_17385 [Lachnospiraceae bacterium]|nr:hypothetical protein [Lachnospiraceae bacterium]